MGFVQEDDDVANLYSIVNFDVFQPFPKVRKLQGVHHSEPVGKSSNFRIRWLGAEFEMIVTKKKICSK